MSKIYNIFKRLTFTKLIEEGRLYEKREKMSS
jgi:hypothetical protein